MALRAVVVCGKQRNKKDEARGGGWGMKRLHA